MEIISLLLQRSAGVVGNRKGLPLRFGNAGARGGGLVQLLDAVILTLARRIKDQTAARARVPVFVRTPIVWGQERLP